MSLPPLPTPARREMIQALADHFYINEQATLVRNGLSTDLLVFPSDLLPAHRGFLDTKIQDAIAYATVFRDVDELDTLVLLPSPKPDGYLTLGLFLYMEDECNRLGKKKTFLTAMREAGEIHPNNTENRNIALERTLAALDILGMRKSHGHIIEEWFNHGTYTINEVTHCTKDGALVGAYAKLASTISRQQGTFGMNKAISYALGNKDHIREGMDATKLYALTENREKPVIEACITAGEREREARIREKIGETSIPSFAGVYTENSDIKSILSLLPDAALEVLYNSGYTCAYANHENISRCYPEKRLPGVSEESYRVMSISKGGRQSRYRVLFLSNGIRDDLEENDALRHQVIAQTMCHEIMHMAVALLAYDKTDKTYMTENEEILKKEIEAVSKEIAQKKETLPEYFHQKMRTMNANTLEEILDCEAEYYRGSPKMSPDGFQKYIGYIERDGVTGEPIKDTRWEEVVCNLYGLMHTEFPMDADVNNPYNALPSLKHLAEHVEEIMEQAREESRKLPTAKKHDTKSIA